MESPWGQNDCIILDSQNTCANSRCGGSSLTASVALINGGIISILNSVTRNEGGDQITAILSEYLADEFMRKFKVDPR